MVHAGRFRETVTIRRRTVAADACGDAVPTWSDLASRRAEVTPLSGRELWQTQQAQSDVTVRVRMRYESALAITPRDRLAWRGRTLEVASAVDVEGAGRLLELLCVEVS